MEQVFVNYVVKMFYHNDPGCPEPRGSMVLVTWFDRADELAGGTTDVVRSPPQTWSRGPGEKVSAPRAKAGEHRRVFIASQQARRALGRMKMPVGGVTQGRRRGARRGIGCSILTHPRRLQIVED